MLLRKIVFYLTLNSIFISVTFGKKSNENLIMFIDSEKFNKANCINNILNKHIPCGDLVTFVNPNMNTGQLITTMKDDNFCYDVIVRSFDSQNWFIWANVYVIAVEDVQELLEGISTLSRDLFWNPRARFIVEMNNLNHEEVRQAFNVFLKYKIYKVIILKSSSDDADIYAYYPFGHQNCGKKFDDPSILGSCNHLDKVNITFKNDFANTLKNCTIKVVASDDVPNFITEWSNFTIYGKVVVGVEQFVLENIAAREGFNIEYKVFPQDEPEGIVLPNRTTTGLLNYLDTNKADIASGGFLLILNRVEKFDYLWGFNYGAFNVFTPVEQTQLWKRVYKEFGGITWVLVTTALFLTLVCCKLFSRLLNDRTYSAMNLWGYFFGNSNRGLSRDKRLRPMIFWWASFTFFISSFYNTALYSLITLHIHDKPQSLTVDNLRSLPYKPCISDNWRTFFLFAYNQSLPENDPPIHKCSFTDDALEFVASSQDHYTIEMEYSYALEEYKYLDGDGIRKLHAWIFSTTYIIVMYMARGSPFHQIFQKLGNRMFETGLIANHMNTLSLKNISVLKRLPKVFRKTGLFDIRMHFYILFIGYGVSFICFLLEILYKHLKIVEGKKVKKLRRPQCAVELIK